MVLEWDNRMMGLRDETRIEGLLIQTHFGMVLRGNLRAEPKTTVRYGLRVVA